MLRNTWAFVLAFAVASACAPAQMPNSPNPQLVPRTPDQREHTYDAQRRIHLHVVVTDASGKPVTGLKPDDFTVLDHQESEKIAEFEDENKSTVENDAVHGIIVLDAINGGKGVERVRKELVKMLGQGQGPLAYPLEMAVVSDAGNRESKPTTDRGALIKDLTELARNVRSTDCDLAAPGSDIRDSRIGAGFLGQMNSAQLRWDCLNSHLIESLNALKSLAEEQQRVNGRAILIWTGSGWPLPQKFDTGQIMGGGGPQGSLSDAIFSLEADLQQGQVTLEAVSWGKFERAKGVRRAGLQGSLAGASITEQETALELPTLAEQTGGLVLEKSKDLADALNTSVADGEQYYSISYDPPPAKDRGEYHSIEVKVDRPGATVRTLSGYYAQP